MDGDIKQSSANLSLVNPMGDKMAAHLWNDDLDRVVCDGGARARKVHLVPKVESEQVGRIVDLERNISHWIKRYSTTRTCIRSGLVQGAVCAHNTCIPQQELRTVHIEAFRHDVFYCRGDGDVSLALRPRVRRRDWHCMEQTTQNAVQ
jgi:hypothetical protein